MLFLGLIIAFLGTTRIVTCLYVENTPYYFHTIVIPACEPRLLLCLLPTELFTRSITDYPCTDPLWLCLHPAGLFAQSTTDFLCTQLFPVKTFLWTLSSASRVVHLGPFSPHPVITLRIGYNNGPSWLTQCMPHWEPKGTKFTTMRSNSPQSAME